MSTISTSLPDLAAVKARQQQTWASGDYGAVAARIQSIADQLVEAADLRPGQQVLDIATGTGNAALAAARHGCAVTGVDYVPALLDRARARAAAEALPVSFTDGDAEALPFSDASFDAVTSCLGVMFTPDHPRTAAELTRVCRPGGTIALANWTPSGFIGQVLGTVVAYVPPPAGVASPLMWGTEDHQRQLFDGQLARLETSNRQFVFKFASAEEFAGLFRDTYGPVHKAFAALDDPGRQRLWDDLVALANQHNRSHGPTLAIPSDYLQTIAVRN